MLTPEERQDLERQRCEAKLRCKEVWGTIKQLSKIAETYLAIHDRWNERFKKADARLAEEDRLTIAKLGKREQKQMTKLSREAILRIAKELEVMVEEGNDRSI